VLELNGGNATTAGDSRAGCTHLSSHLPVPADHGAVLRVHRLPERGHLLALLEVGTYYI